MRFLSELESRPRPPDIYLLGDIFDLWVSGHQIFVTRFQPIVDSLDRLRRRGARLVFFEGNHDLHIHPYWRDVLKCEVHVGPAVFTQGGLRIRCEHGDEINQDDRAYLRLRRFLRHPVMEFLAHRLPGTFWDALGRRAAATSRKYSSVERETHEERLRRMIRAHAERICGSGGFDVMISGHMHVRDDWTFNCGGRPVRSINLGSWFDEPQVLVLEGLELKWRQP